MEQYSEYKDSGVNWIRKIPVDWKLRRVKDFFHISRGRVIAVGDLIENGRYPVYSSQTTNDGCFGYLDTFDYDKDCLTWTTDGALAGTVFLRQGRFSCTNICGILTPKRRGYNLRFLFYVLSEAGRHNKRIDTNGAKIMSNEMAPIRFPVPTIIEQEAIASFLDQEIGKIDEKLSRLEEKTRLYNELKQSVINETVTRGLDESAPLRDSGIPWIGKIPEHWKVTRNKNLFGKIKRKAGPKSGEFDVLSLTLKGVIKRDMENLKGKVPASFDSYLICKPGDLVLCLFDMDVTPQIVGLVNDRGIITSAYTLLEAFKGVSVNYFLYYFLAQNKNGSLLANSKTLRSTMTFDLFGQIAAPLPPHDEQIAIAKHLDERIEKIDQVVAAINGQVKLLKELRKTLINDVVTGKIRVTKTEKAVS